MAVERDQPGLVAFKSQAVDAGGRGVDEPQADALARAHGEGFADGAVHRDRIADAPGVARIHRVAEVLDLPTSRIRVIQSTVGGSFGGKLSEDSNLYIASCLALACRAPVRLVNTRTEDFLGARPRMPTRIELKMGADREGRITAITRGSTGANPA